MSVNNHTNFRKNKLTRCPLNFLGKTNNTNFKKILDYHDFRWCKPIHYDDELFAMFILEIMQAGLSWNTILKKEEFIRKAFDNFQINIVANYNDKKIDNLMKNDKIIKNKIKIKAAINNAKMFLKIQKEFNSFDSYIWKFTKNETIDHNLLKIEDMPIKNDISEKVSLDLKKRGFQFVGPIITYSYMQAIGIFNDHYLFCSFR